MLETLHSHLDMIDLSPSHESRVPVKAPPEASPEEYHCKWYEITDKVSYLPAGMYSGKVSFKACFHDLHNGLQIHVYAPMGLDIKQKWTLGGNLPHEPVMPREIGVGAPVSGLYLREDIELKCNFLMTRFVRKTLKDSLSTLVARLVVKAQLQEADANNRRLTYGPDALAAQGWTPPLSPGMSNRSLSPPVSPRMPLSPPPSAGYNMQQQMAQGPPGQQQQQYAEYNPAKWEEQQRRVSAMSYQGGFQGQQQLGQSGLGSMKGRASFPSPGYVPHPSQQGIPEMEATPPAELAG